MNKQVETQIQKIRNWNIQTYLKMWGILERRQK
jgi:hypothetical protein